MHDVADRLANRVQLTTDGHAVYLNTALGAFGIAVDYAQLIKLYGPRLIWSALSGGNTALANAVELASSGSLKSP
jgi:hypothetical protein